jgi:glycosyltransferase involved in cell wall biosynthesis
VLVVCEYASLNGGERSLLSVIDGVRSAGLDLCIAAPPTGPLAEALTDLNVPLVPLVLHDNCGTRLSLDECRRRASAAIVETRPDLVHANSLSMSRLTGPVAADLGVPSIGHLRDIVKVSSAVVADVNRHCRLLAVSEATRQWFVSAGLDASKVHVLFNGVDLNGYCPRPPTGFLHRELGLPLPVCQVGAIGQIGMRKGLDVLAEAARHVVATVPEVHFVVVGKRYSQKQEAVDYERELSRATSTEPLAGKFSFLGVREDVPRVLNELTVLAHAARQEPLGRVLLEAAASGTPIVATDVGGTREIFPAASSAADLVPVDDPHSLAAAIIRLLEDGQRREQLGKLARLRAEEAFDARVAAAKLVAHYRQVLS